MTQEMRDCLGQVASSLLFFLDHPDTRVRLGSARTLIKLAASYSEEMQKMDLSRAKAALKRCDAKVAEGCEDTDSQELRPLLVELLSPEPVKSAGGAVAVAAEPPATTPAEDTEAAPVTAPSRQDGGPVASDGRGEIVLKIGENAEAKVKASILEKVVAISGVVSVAFEGPYIIVSTRTPSLAADASFLAAVLTGVGQLGISGVSLVRTSNGALQGSPSKGKLEEPVANSNAKAGATLAAVEEDEEEVEELDDDDDGSEPQYLDDQEETTAPSAFDNQRWSFFSQQHWMTGRQVQEFGDDPTIAARLAKAKKREEEKRNEERSTLSRIAAWWGRR